MLRDEQNLSNQSVALKDNTPLSNYTKLNKLIMALYMVTDIIDKDEPLRAKLRDLGADVIKDINGYPAQAVKKISEIVAFLDIASAVKMVSEMNANILKKEFIVLKQSIGGFTDQNDSLWLENFIASSTVSNTSITENPKTNFETYREYAPTRIGVQKGSTLMKALSEVRVSDKVHSPSVSKTTHSTAEDFNVLKKKRRDEILKIISTNSLDGMTITDIRNSVKTLGENNTLASCSEKTLQRELLSMLKDNVLNKSGEKRWSKYFLPK